MTEHGAGRDRTPPGVVPGGEGRLRARIAELEGERGRLRAAFAESEERFRVTLAESPVGISISRVRDGLIHEMNDEFLRILGFARDEVVGRTSSEIGLWTGADQRAAIVGEFRERGRVTPRPVTMRRKDGSLVTVLFSASALGGGEEPRTIAWVMDVTDRLCAEEALRVSEQRWRTLAESAPVVIMTLGEEGTVLSVNHTVTGRTVADYVGRKAFEFLHPDHRERGRVSIGEAVARGVPHAGEYPVLRPDGVACWFQVSIAPLAGAAGPERAILVATDIDARRRAEAALRESEGRWRSLVENIPAIILTLDRRGTILTLNHAFAGHTPGEVVGSVIHDYCADPGERARSVALVGSVFSTGIPVQFEMSGRSAEGAPLRMRNVLAPLRSAGGEVEAAIAVVADVTEESASAEALRESEQRFRDTVQSLGDWVWEVDVDGRTTYSSPQVEGLLGWSAGEMLGKSPWDTCGPEERRRYLEGQEKLTGHPIPFRDREIWHLHKDGTRVCLSVSGVPIRGADGSLRGYRGVAHDVTARRGEEEERRRLEAEVQHSRRVESLGVLAGGIAHDFNNLLTAILGNAELALAELPEGGVRPLVAQIQAAGLHAAELTRQMLAYAGRGHLAPARVDLTAAVREMAQLLGSSIPKKVALELALAESLPAVEADPAQLRQVVMNLVMNAADAIGDREGRIEVRTVPGVPGERFRADLALGRIEEGREQVCVDVADSGAGIAPDDLARIFDPFFTTKFTGRGLGLAAVQGVVLRHGGTIAVSTDPGAGTTFRVCFPALPPAAGEEPARAAAPPIAVAASPWRGGGTVLLVDDEEPVRDMAARMLRLLGFEVVAAANGREAVAAAGEAAGVRAVLLDLTMPHMDGRETFHELRRLRPGLPVVLCSGYDVLESADRFAGMDFAGYLQKPYRVEDLARALRRALGE